MYEYSNKQLIKKHSKVEIYCIESIYNVDINTIS